MSIFSDRLRKCRDGKGLSQSDMAKVLNVSRQAYSTYETGSRKPDIDALSVLAEYFDTTTDYLLGRTEASDEKSKPEEKGVYLPAVLDARIESAIRAIVRQELNSSDMLVYDEARVHQLPSPPATQEQREPIYVQQVARNGIIKGKWSRESAEILLAKAKREKTRQDSAEGTEDK